MTWLVAITAPNMESRAAVNLLENGLKCYLPKFIASIVRQGRACKRPLVLFPRYIFVRFNESWPVVMRTREITGIILSGETPAPLTNEIVDEIKSREGRDGFIKIENMRRFKNGQQVRPVKNKLLTGIVAGMSGPDRVNVLFDILGGQRPVSMKETELEVA